MKRGHAPPSLHDPVEPLDPEEARRGHTPPSLHDMEGLIHRCEIDGSAAGWACQHRGMSPWKKLFELAAANGGVITTAMALQVGLSAAALRERAQREGWPQVGRGAWLAPGMAAPTGHDAAGVHLRLLGGRAALSHESAGFAHGLLREPPAEVQVILPMDRRPEPRDGVRLHRSRTLTTGDITDVDGLQVTTVPRTLRDLAAGRSWEAVYDLVTDAEQRRLVNLDVLVDTMHRLHHGAGSGIFRDVVHQRRADRSDSALERDTRDASSNAGFRPSAGPFPIRVATGALLRLDVAFPSAWFAIECDGFGFHRDRRAFERDRTRWRLAQQAGWRLTWVTRRRLRDDLPGLLEEIAEAHRTADAGRAPAQPAA